MDGAPTSRRLNMWQSSNVRIPEKFPRIPNPAPRIAHPPLRTPPSALSKRSLVGQAAQQSRSAWSAARSPPLWPARNIHNRSGDLRTHESGGAACVRIAIGGYEYAPLALPGLGIRCGPDPQVKSLAIFDRRFAAGPRIAVRRLCYPATCISDFFW
jgi:hypothetical protein